MRVILASTSPARLALLRQSGIEPQLQSPGVDEEAAIEHIERDRGQALSVPEHVLVLARLKAAAVVRAMTATEPDLEALVIGGDSMFELDGEVFGKPYLADVATRRWHDMRGRSGTLHSGHSVWRCRPGTAPEEATAVAQARVSFCADIDDDEIDAYVATGEPLQVAGAFTIDSRAAAFIDHIDGEPSTVIGMSLASVRRLVRDLGVSWPSLWNRAERL